MRTRERRPIIDRFWEKVDQSAGPNGCWPWSSAIQFGYGIFWLGDGTSVRAHRFAYEMANGPIADGLTLDHLCRNRRCVNPTHLDPCTKGENAARSPNAPYWRKAAQTHCKRGHAFDEKNTHVSADGRRSCRRCNADRAYAKKHPKAEAVAC